MLVKRYVVKEMPEAVAMIREELGKDAVILSTKKVQTRGFLGLFSKTHIEVIAAANEQEDKSQRPTAPQVSVTQKTPPQAPAKPTPPAPAAATESPVAPVFPRQAAMGAYRQARTPMPEANPEADARDAEQPIVPPRVEFPRVETESVAELKSETKTRPKIEKKEPAAATAPVQEDVLKEVQELRALIRTFVNSSHNPMLPEAVTRVREQLLDRELDQEAVDELIERGIRHFQQVQEIDEQEFRLILTNFIKEELDQLEPPSQLQPETRIAAFIGPTGVGKTTTIAKLAAEQVLTKGKKVGLITTDTYRIAAVEQLRTYANILNVPLEVCYSPEDVKRALDKFDDRDLIFVDTAGRNYGNELNVKELNSYLQVLQPDETYLVLALTTKPSDLNRIVSNFAQVMIDKLLFTKADETEAYGAIYNLTARHKIPLSYLTIGQNVPDDIETVSTGKLSSLIVGENSYA
ncbi:MAG TPA: flagellar biosynthesis protein FlhF [Bacilli bacterium]|nr:flagellar biosynthesis protein FlhF [Bacilli bacterium]